MIGCSITMLSKTVQDIRKTDCSFLVHRPVCLTTSIIPGKPTMSKQASDQGARSSNMEISAQQAAHSVSHQCVEVQQSCMHPY